MTNWTLEFRPEEDASVARVIIAGNWIGDVKDVRSLLIDICRQWPPGCKVRYLITCGGFLQFSWPFAPVMGRTGRPALTSPNTLISVAQKCCDSLLHDNLVRRLTECTRYLTLGVDSEEESSNQRKPHVELVGLFDLEQQNWHWTGKSYPRGDQVAGLVQITDLRTHFVDLEGERVMILGCHDLNMFSNRAKATTKKEWRSKISRDILTLAKKNEPTRVIQHPHTTDSVRNWATAMSGLWKSVPTVREFASAGKWYRKNKWGLPEEPRSPLQKVLETTKLGQTIDIIVRWR